MQYQNSTSKREPVSCSDFSSGRKDKNIRQAAGSVVDYQNQAEALLNFKNLNYESVTSSPGSYQIVKPMGSNVPETPNWNPVSQSNLMSATGRSINQHAENGGLTANQRTESDSSFRIQVRQPQTMRNNQGKVMPRAKPQRKLKLVKTQRSINVVNNGALVNAQGGANARNKDHSKREESKQEIKPQYVGVCRNGMLKLGAFNTQSSANQMTEAETFTLRPMESTGNLQAQFSSRTHMFSSQRTEEDFLVSKLLTHQASDFSAGVVSDRNKIESRYTSAQALQNLTPQMSHQHHQILSADDQMISTGRNNFSTIRAIQEVPNKVLASDQSAQSSIKKQQDAQENQQARVAKAYQALNTMILEPEMAYENMEEEKFTTLKKGSLDASSKQVTDKFMIREEASSRFEESSAKPSISAKQQLFSHIHRPSQCSSHRQLHQTQINPFSNDILEEGELLSQIRHSIADQIPQIKDQFGNTKLLSSKDKLMVPTRGSNFQSQFFTPSGRNLIQLNTQSQSTKNYNRNLNSDVKAKESSHQNIQQYPQHQKHSDQNVQQAIQKLSSNNKHSNNQAIGGGSHIETNSSPRNAFFQNFRILDSEKTSCVFGGLQQSEDQQQLKSGRDVWSPNERCDGTSLAETNFKNESVDRKQFSQHTNGSVINVMPEHVDMSSANQQSIQDSCFSDKAVTVTVKQHLNYRSIDGVVNQMTNKMHGQGANLHRKQSQPEFTIKRPSLNQQRTLKPRIQTAYKSQITNHQQGGPKAQLLHRMHQPQEQKGATRKVKFGSQANGNPVSIIQLMRNQKTKRRSVEDLRQESQAQHKMEVTQVRAIYEQIGATELVSPQSRRRSDGSIRRNEQDYDHLMDGSKVQLHVMDFGQDQELDYRDSKRGASPELLDFPSAIKHKGLGSLATTQQASLVNAAALIEENIYPPARVSKINLQNNAVVDHIYHDPNLQSNLRNMSVGSITQVYEEHQEELSEEPSIGDTEQKEEKTPGSPAKIDFSLNNNHLAGQKSKQVNSTSPKQRNVKAYKHQQLLNLALQNSAMHSNSQSRPNMKAYMHSRNNYRASDDFSQIQQQFFLSLDQTKQSGSALYGVIKGEQPVTNKHMYTTQNFSAANINQSFLPFTSAARQELPLELEIDFTKQMNEVQRERNTKIAKQFKQQTARIKKYSKHLNDNNLASLKAQKSKSKGNNTCKTMKEGTLLMNKQVYDQMQTMPQTGRLTRLQLNPFADSSFQQMPETVSNKARGNTTKLSVRTEVQKSVYIDNSKLEKTKEKVNLQNSENVAKKQVNIVVNKSIDVSEDIVNTSNDEQQQSLNNTAKDNLATQKAAAQPVMTINDNFFKMMDKELEAHFQKLPRVQALQFESLDPQIVEYLKRRQYSCQNYTIVGKTQEGTNDQAEGSYANRLRQEQIQAKMKSITDRFQRDREQVQQDLNQKWQQVQNEYCIDFTQKRLDQQRELRVQKNWSFIRSLIEAVKIVTDDRFPLDKNVILDTQIFPVQSYQSGQVKRFLKEVKSGNLRQVAVMIKLDPLVVFQFDEMQQSGLIWAVKRNNEEMTRLLLQKFSRVNFQDLTGRSALSFAVSQSNMAIIKLLLCFKADPKSKNNGGQTIYEIYEKAMNKHTNLQIGQYLRLCKDQLIKQSLIQDGWKFVELVKNDFANHTSWTRQMIRDREWKNQVLVILDPTNTIEQDELKWHKDFK